MKRFSKLLCFMVVFISVMAAFCAVSFAADFSNWTNRSNMLNEVHNFGSVSMDDKIYVFGGMSISSSI